MQENAELFRERAAKEYEEQQRQRSMSYSSPVRQPGIELGGQLAGHMAGSPIHTMMQQPMMQQPMYVMPTAAPMMQPGWSMASPVHSPPAAIPQQLPMALSPQLAAARSPQHTLSTHLSLQQQHQADADLADALAEATAEPEPVPQQTPPPHTPSQHAEDEAQKPPDSLTPKERVKWKKQERQRLEDLKQQALLKTAMETRNADSEARKKLRARDMGHT